MILSTLLCSVALHLGAPIAFPVASGDEWPQWRGPTANGVAAGPAPQRWSEEEGIRWKADLPGAGSSTPIVWGDRIYLTTAVKTDRVPESAATEAGASGQDGADGADGRDGHDGADGTDGGDGWDNKLSTEPQDGQDGGQEGERRRRRGGEQGEGGRGRGRGGRGRGTPPTQIHEFMVLALDRANGKEVWRTKVTETVPHESGHSTNTQASASPVTDGKHIYAFFGSRGIHCLDMDGKLVWSKELGRMETRNQFGEGASPALHGDTLVIVWDHEGEDFIAAFDKANGEERWRQERDEVTTWVTPLIVPVGDKHQVIVPATDSSRAYDLETGEIVWTLAGMTTNCIPTPLYEDGVVYLMSGFRGSALQAVRLEGAKGDLEGSDNILWVHSKGTSYVPSGVLTDGAIYFLRTNSGVLSCVDAATGKVHYDGERLGDMRAVYASVTAAGDHLYIPSREGLTAVVKTGPEFELVAVNALDEVFDASPVIVDGEVYLRGTRTLYCIEGH